MNRLVCWSPTHCSNPFYGVGSDRHRLLTELSPMTTKRSWNWQGHDPEAGGSSSANVENWDMATNRRASSARDARGTTGLSKSLPELRRPGPVPEPVLTLYDAKVKGR